MSFALKIYNHEKRLCFTRIYYYFKLSRLLIDSAPDLSFKYAEKGIGLGEKHKNYDYLADFYNTKGLILTDLGHYENALKAFNKSLYSEKKRIPIN